MPDFINLVVSLTDILVVFENFLDYLAGFDKMLL